MKLDNKWREHLDEIIDVKDVPIRGFTVKDELDPDIWQNEQRLKDYIAEHLYKIAKNFFVNLDLEWKIVKDVILTGSIANYNWSIYSDIDLHILVDFRDVDNNEKLVKDFFKNATMNWNRTHKIIVKDHEVELYVQDSRETHHSTGVYSLKNDRWVKTPTKYNPTIDYANVQKKAAKLMNDIDEINELFAYKEYKQSYGEADRMKARIRKFRKTGLEKGGEYSVENLAFKVLRRSDYLQKLSSLKIMSYDKMMSVNGGIGSEIIKINLKEGKE